MIEDEVKYRIFKRRSYPETCTFGTKREVKRNLTYTEAQQQCREFNLNRTTQQIKESFMMEFEPQ